MNEQQSETLLALILFKLQSFSSANLLELIGKAATLSPEFFKYLQQITDLDPTNLNTLNFSVEDSDNDIALMLNYDIEINSVNDYERVRSYCSRIISATKSRLESKKCDDIVKILAPIMEFFTECIYSELDLSMFSSEGPSEIQKTIINDLQIFNDALKQSNLTQAEKLIIALNCKAVSFETLAANFQEYINEEYSQDIWNEVANILLAILNKNYKNLHLNFKIKFEERSQLLECVLDALQKAERINDILTLCTHEAKNADEETYSTLVNSLANIKAYDEAEKYVHRKDSDASDNPMFVLELHDILFKIKMATQDWVAACILQVEKFATIITEEDMDSYFECKDVADKLSIWPELRTTLLTYLETGTLPWKQSTWPKVLANSELKPLELEINNYQCPEIELILAITLQEHDYEKIIYWYEQYYIKSTNTYKPAGFRHTTEQVTHAITNYPSDKSIAVLKLIAEDYMTTAKSKDYPDAIKLFQNVKDVMLKSNQEQNWLDYLSSIKTKYKRKINFVTLANSL